MLVRAEKQQWQLDLSTWPPTSQPASDPNLNAFKVCQPLVYVGIYMCVNERGGNLVPI